MHVLHVLILLQYEVSRRKVLSKTYTLICLFTLYVYIAAAEVANCGWGWELHDKGLWEGFLPEQENHSQRSLPPLPERPQA